MAKHSTGDALTQGIHGREVPSNPAAHSTIGRAREWIKACDENHDCVETHFPELPSRYLDVGLGESCSRSKVYLSDQVRRGHYAALSYSWGADQVAVTTRGNIDEYKCGIEISTLSKSLQDAIYITRRLGIRYLWIDAICIIQQEPKLEDFIAESSKMAQYYNNAYITIAAGCSADSRTGFLSPRPKAALLPCPMAYAPYPDSDASNGLHINQMGTVYVRLPVSKKVGPLESRAWTFQEAELSRRVLMYGKDQFSLNCQKRQMYEDGMVVLSSSRGYQYGATAVQGRNIITIRRQAVTESIKSETLRIWCAAVQKFSFRAMKDPNDKLTALAGMAQYIEPTINSDYLFGMWADDLVRGLLWSSTVQLGAPSFRVPLRRPAVRRAPSWSWASVDGPVQLQHKERYEGKYHNGANPFIKLVTHAIPPRTFDPIRNGCSFELTINGILKVVKRSQVALQEFKSSNQRYKRTIALRARVAIECLLLMAIDSFDGINRELEQANVVGFGMFDVPNEDTRAYALRVLPLTKDEGLLLTDAEDGKFRRVGIFWPEDKDWFCLGQPRDIVLV